MFAEGMGSDFPCGEGVFPSAQFLDADFDLANPLVQVALRFFLCGKFGAGGFELGLGSLAPLEAFEGLWLVVRVNGQGAFLPLADVGFQLADALAEGFGIALDALEADLEAGPGVLRILKEGLSNRLVVFDAIAEGIEGCGDVSGDSFEYFFHVMGSGSVHLLP